MSKDCKDCKNKTKIFKNASKYMIYVTLAFFGAALTQINNVFGAIVWLITTFGLVYAISHTEHYSRKGDK